MPILAPDAALDLVQDEGLVDLGDDAFAPPLPRRPRRRPSARPRTRRRPVARPIRHCRPPGSRGPSLAQEFVAGGMAEGVVDLLEVVEVDEEERQLARVASALACSAKKRSRT